MILVLCTRWWREYLTGVISPLTLYLFVLFKLILWMWQIIMGFQLLMGFVLLNCQIMKHYEVLAVAISVIYSCFHFLDPQDLPRLVILKVSRKVQ